MFFAFFVLTILKFYDIFKSINSNELFDNDRRDGYANRFRQRIKKDKN